MISAPDKGEAIAQCRANILANWRFYGLPELAIQTTQVDRITALCAGWSEDTWKVLVTTGSFARCDYGIQKFHGPTADYSLRERQASTSMQITHHKTGILEIDFDRWSPDEGAGPALLHWFECWIPGKTDAFAIAKGLKKRGILAG